MRPPPSDACVAALPTVARSAYSRTRTCARTRTRIGIGIGIVHLGVGEFHWAHHAVYVDDVLAGDPGWTICSVSLRSPDMRDALRPQDRAVHAGPAGRGHVCG
ncbi:hypothetical protein [Luteimonas deserti]|uniref:hypothetical protein n=1 Tax=Luteimonas deserti TaxID=2752306 RepID=UPI001F270C0C|nr:hypothetical protein [Luteimonas deserti]